MEQLDPQSRKAVLAAQKAAKALADTHVRPAHLLVGLAGGDTQIARVLARFGLTQAHTMKKLSQARAGEYTGQVKVSDELRKVLRDAVSLSRNSGVTVDTSDLARLLLAASDKQVQDLLAESGASADQILSALDAALVRVPPIEEPELPAKEVPDPLAAPAPIPSTGRTTLPADLIRFGRDMVAAAAAGELPPVFGRERELERVQTILGRRTKNNPVLIGEAGVGKTAIVEGLAHALAHGTAVDGVAGRPLVAIDLGSMIGGARSRGDFEDRLKKMVAAAQSVNAILFLDEVHQIVSAGSGAGSLDVANMLKEGMARGEVSIIGATTLDEYRKHIETDAALERRLDKVLVEAPTVAQTIDILRAVKGTFATHHNVQYTDAAVTAAVKLTDKHVRDRNLPDKAIDALDEAGAAASMAIMRSPKDVQDLYKRRAATRKDITAAVKDERYEDAADLSVKDKLLTAMIVQKCGIDLSVIDVEHVAQTVSTIAGVPVGGINADEADILMTLADKLAARVVGQEHAVEIVAKTIRRRRTLGAVRPTSLIFAGPTGVGKTELAKALADIVFPGGASSEGEGQMVRFDMSEFAEKHTVARLIGAAPGYIGYGDGGQLTEAVRRNPHTLVLLDEVEKAHPDVFDVLLQVMEDGHLTDGEGRKVNFTDTVIIMTTNLGSVKAVKTPLGFSSGVQVDQDVAARAESRRAVKEHFRPEFINRIDEIVVFDRLTRTDLTSIVAGLLARPLAQAQTMGVTVRLSDAAVDVLVEAGCDLTMGARPLRRAIVNLLENPLADALLAGELPHGSTAFVDAATDGSRLVVLPAPAVNVDAPVETAAN